MCAITATRLSPSNLSKRDDEVTRSGSPRFTFVLMIVRVFLAVMFVVAGSLHFLISHVYLMIMPPYLPWHLPLVYISGAAEFLGGVGLLIPATRQVAAWGLAALLIAVLPANIYMATSHFPAPGLLGESWAQWLRIPLQFPMIWCVLRAGEAIR